jgi:hypothetical protein
VWALALAGLLTGAGFLCAQAQYFTDETADRIRAVLDQSRDADFGDIDGDGDLDIIVSNAESAHQPNFLYVNDGSGHFTEETSARMPEIHDSTADSEFGDVDGDGDLDLLMVNSSNDPETYGHLFVNDGLGFFVDDTYARMPSRLCSSCTGSDLGDVDGDLDLDYVVSNYGFNRLLLNALGQWFYVATENRFPMGTDESNDIYFGDVDGDFDLDVLVINGLGEQNRLLINDGGGRFTDETTGRRTGVVAVSWMWMETGTWTSSSPTPSFRATTSCGSTTAGATSPTRGRSGCRSTGR